MSERRGSFSRLALYIILTGWTGFAVFVALFIDSPDGGSFIEHFLSTEEGGVKFRALVFFLPLISTAIGFLVNEREKFLVRTLASEERYRDLFENANDPILLVDGDMGFLDVNRKAVEVFGFSKMEFLTMNIRDLVVMGLDGAEGGPAAQGGEIGEKFVSRMRARDGLLLDVEISSSAIVKHGRVAGFRKIVRDITELKQIQDELNNAYKGLEQLLEERTNTLRDTKKKLTAEMDERRRVEAELQEAVRRSRN